jgi:hypothetical protein
MGRLILASLVSGGIISLYVIGLAWISLHNLQSDPLEAAARQASASLSHLTVFDTTHGPLSLEAHDNYLTRIPSRSFNTALALNRQALQLASKHRLPLVSRAAREDLAILKSQEQLLIDKLHASIANQGTIYQQVANRLRKSTRPGETLKELSIELGTVPRRFNLTSVPVAQDEANRPYSKGGYCKALTAIALPEKNLGEITLHQEIPESQIVTAADFQPSPRHHLPSVLKIKALYESKQNHLGAQTKIFRRQTYALIASGNNHTRQASSLPRSSCFVLSFPHGKPEQTASLSSLWKKRSLFKSGLWLQTVDGHVPGAGHLAPPIGSIWQDSNAVDASSLLFYHWLRQLEKPSYPERLARILEANWNLSAIKTPIGHKNENTNESEPESEASPANSCLVINSMAREYAFLRQNAPLEAGQKALGRAFANIPPKFPNSALAMVVNSNGRAYLPGRTLFEEKLVQELLRNLYDTNLAARDSIALAKISNAYAHQNLLQQEEKLFLLKAELESLKLSSTKVTDKAREEAIEIHKNQIKIAQDKCRQVQNLIALSAVLKSNAQNVARESFELASKLFPLTSGGIHRWGKEGFLLGKSFIFRPLPSALSEAELLEINASNLTEKIDNHWLRSDGKLSVFSKFTPTASELTKINVEGLSLAELTAQQAPIAKAPVCFVVLDSRTICQKGNFPAQPYVMTKYPFTNSPSGSGEMVYYCANGFTTGENPTVFWSLLARDLVALKDAKAPPQASLPLESNSWCKDFAPYRDEEIKANQCPKLACEFQMRSPVVLRENLSAQINNQLQELTLTDPNTSQRVSLFPPVNLDLF